LTRAACDGQHVAVMGTDLRAARNELDAGLPGLRAQSTDRGTLELIVVRPSEGEVAHNPRAGSGRLRAALKLASAGGEGSAGRAPKIGSEGR